MAWFVKHETFTAETAVLPLAQRRLHIQAHCEWVKDEIASGRNIYSGYLVDREKRPGGGGLLIFAALNYEEALSWVEQDPIIRAGLVHWSLDEWIYVAGINFAATSTWD